MVADPAGVALTGRIKINDQMSVWRFTHQRVKVLPKWFHLKIAAVRPGGP